VSPQSASTDSRSDGSPNDTDEPDEELIEGSMQEFVTYQTTVGDLSINVLPAREVRKIAILDM